MANASKKSTTEVVVEFYGVPRRRARRDRLHVHARTLAEVITQVACECAGLADLQQADGQLAPHYLVSLNGRTFVGDLDHPLHAGD